MAHGVVRTTSACCELGTCGCGDGLTVTE